MTSPSLNISGQGLGVLLVAIKNPKMQKKETLEKSAVQTLKLEIQIDN